MDRPWALRVIGGVGQLPLTLEQLGEGAAVRLAEVGYAPITIKHYKEHFKAFARYAEDLLLEVKG